MAPLSLCRTALIAALALWRSRRIGAVLALAHPISRYAQETADQLLDTRAYVAAVMSNVGVSVPAHLREDPH